MGDATAVEAAEGGHDEVRKKSKKPKSKAVVAKLKSKKSKKPKEAKAKPAEAVGDATAAEAAEGVHDKVMRKPAAAKSKKPGLCLERTRSQVMCRSGLGGPGSTKAIKYGPGAPFKSEEDALRAARIWLAQETKRQAGLIVIKKPFKRLGLLKDFKGLLKASQTSV